MKDQIEKKDNEIVLELSFRLKMKDYKLRLQTKRAWLIALVLLVVRIASFLLRDGPP